jgi:hypothetical protein
MPLWRQSLCYQRGIQVYEFQSRCRTLRELTLDRTGCELPAVYAPWDAENTWRALSASDHNDPLMKVPVRPPEGSRTSTLRIGTGEAGRPPRPPPAAGAAKADRCHTTPRFRWRPAACAAVRCTTATRQWSFRPSSDCPALHSASVVGDPSAGDGHADPAVVLGRPRTDWHRAAAG